MNKILNGMKKLFNSSKIYKKNINTEEREERRINWRYEIEDDLILAIPSDLNVTKLNTKVEEILNKNTNYEINRCYDGATNHPNYSFIECIEIKIINMKEIEKRKALEVLL